MPNDVSTGPQITDQWVTSRKAILAFEQFCVDQKWVFVEVSEQKDFGKDGYLDFSESGELNGLCIAVQVKGGKSLRRVGDFTFHAKESQRRLWRESTVPVFAVIWDPDDILYWVNLTDILSREGQDAPIKVPRNNRLDEGGLDTFIEAAWVAASTSPPLVALGSTDVELQTAAIWDCYGLGRRDPEYLILLRRVMFRLEPEAIKFAINVLDTCSLNMDNFVDTQWMAQAKRVKVRESFRWTIDEAVALLDQVYDDGNGYFGRASFGSGVYWLIVGTKPNSDHFVKLVEAAVWRAIDEGRLHAAAMGLLLWMFWLGDEGQATLYDVLERYPTLAHHDEIAMLVERVNTYGKIEL